MRRRTIPIVVLAALLGAALSLCSAVPAQAHDSLVGSDPNQGEVVDRDVNVITLTFSDAVLDLGGRASSLVQVSDDAGLFYNDGCVSLSDETLTAGVALGGPGTYTVAWRIASVDGHPISDTFTFEYAPPANVKAVAGIRETPSCGTEAEKPGTEPASEATGRDSVSAGLALGIGAGVILLIAGAVGVAVSGRLRARERRESRDS